MREILFRGKKENGGDWAYGSLHIQRGETENSGKYTGDEYRILGMIGEREYIIPETVGQYTGLNDKNGKKIFEGDIVVFSQFGYATEIGSIEMTYGAFGLRRKQGYYRPFKDWLEDFEYEKIGNIHDNPELLEVVSE